MQLQGSKTGTSGPATENSSLCPYGSSHKLHVVSSSSKRQLVWSRGRLRMNFHFWRSRKSEWACLGEVVLAMVNKDAIAVRDQRG